MEETKAFVLNDFHNNIKQHECKQVVFFYSQEKLKKVHGEIALKKMQQNDSFILYQNGKLKEAIEEFLSKSDIKQ